MAKNFVLHDADAAKVKMLRDEVQKVRIWFGGWEAAGKAAPPGTQCLWQLMLLFDQSLSKAK